MVCFQQRCIISGRWAVLSSADEKVCRQRCCWDVWRRSLSCSYMLRDPILSVKARVQTALCRVRSQPRSSAWLTLLLASNATRPLESLDHASLWCDVFLRVRLTQRRASTPTVSAWASRLEDCVFCHGKKNGNSPGSPWHDPCQVLVGAALSETMAGSSQLHLPSGARDGTISVWQPPAAVSSRIRSRLHESLEAPLEHRRGVGHSISP